MTPSRPGNASTVADGRGGVFNTGRVGEKPALRIVADLPVPLVDDPVAPPQAESAKTATAMLIVRLDMLEA